MEVASKFSGQIEHQIVKSGKLFISKMKFCIPLLKKQKYLLLIPNYSALPKTTIKKLILKNNQRKLVTMKTYLGFTFKKNIEYIISPNK